MADPAIEAVGLTRRFGDVVAVDRIDLTVPRGEVFGFLGPNGAGKTTTIRMLCGLLAPSAGTVRVLGVDVTRTPEAVRARIGYMVQRGAQYGDLTVEEVLHFYARIYGLPPQERRRKVAGWIQRAGLAGRERQLVGTLSGGWRQRLALGCAVLHHPDLLLLDEPTSGTDPVQRREFWDLIYRFADEGTTVLVTTHYMDEAEHCTTLAFIHGGRIIAQGPPADVRRRVLGAGVVEVVAEPWQQALQVLRGWPRARSAALYGTAVHVVADDPHGAAVEAPEVLRAQGLRVHRVEVRPASLEDVFVALMGPPHARGAGG
jgi:ABC-2 type transport system ATP-binding protein